jgi:hypothetical protein
MMKTNSLVEAIELAKIMSESKLGPEYLRGNAGRCLEIIVRAMDRGVSLRQFSRIYAKVLGDHLLKQQGEQK